MTRVQYSIFKSPSSTLKEYETDSWQQAIDLWSNLKATGNSPFIKCKHENNKRVVNSKSGISEWSNFLMLNRYNRVERRIMEEMQEQKQQEEDGMKLVETKDTGNYGYNDYLEGQEAADYEAAIEESKHLHNLVDNHKNPDFHGNFQDMDFWTQEQIINPKHYKIIPKEAYAKHPEGLEYMDVMEYALAHLSGVESHTMGHVFKYSFRIGKKDAKLQDAKKIAWYANRMVEILEGETK